MSKSLSPKDARSLYINRGRLPTTDRFLATLPDVVHLDVVHVDVAHVDVAQ